jgi:hypothetical protein
MLPLRLNSGFSQKINISVLDGKLQINAHPHLFIKNVLRV